MPTKIKPKRGTGAPTTGDLEANEIAMDMAAGKLYVNNGGTIAVLANNYTLDADTTPQLGGNLDLNSNNIDGTGNIDITGALTLSGDITGDSGDLNIVNSVNGSNIVLKVDDASGTAQTGLTVGTDDYVSNDTVGGGGTDTTAYKSFFQNTSGGLKIGSGELSSTGNTPDNDEGDYEFNGLIIEPTGNSWPAIKLFSTGQATGKNPAHDRFGAGSTTEFPQPILQFGAANGTVASPTALTDTKRVGHIAFAVHDGDKLGGANSIASASITSFAIEDAATTNARAVKMVFDFLPSGGSASDGDSSNDRSNVLTMQQDQVTITPTGNDCVTFEDNYLRVDAADIDFTNLPTTDPTVAGRLWNDSGTMKISAG